MVEVGRFVDELKAAGIGLLTGVPDSPLKSFCAYVTDIWGEKCARQLNTLDSPVINRLHYTV